MSFKQPIIVDPREEAAKYMEQKKVYKLFDLLGALIAREKPENPNEFLILELQKIAKLKELNQPATLFTREDIDTMFTTFDITNRGYVTQKQFMKALTALGIDPSRGGVTIPNDEKIDRNIFVHHIYDAVLKNGY